LFTAQPHSHHRVWTLFMNSLRLLISLALLLPQSLWAEEAAAPPPARVVVAMVEERVIAETSSLMGVIDFDRISEVSGEVSGLIIEQLAVEGKHVKQGDPLVRLNTDLTRKDMDIKRKEQAQVSADMEKVGRTLKRLESLLKNNSASRQAYDDSRFDLSALEQKRATLGQQLQRLQLQLDKSTVRAPFDGLVLNKFKEQGEWLAPGNPICRLASTQDVIAKIAIPESLVRYQKAGEPLSVSLPALGRQLDGNIRGFTPVADLRSKSAILKINLPFTEGMIQNMSIETEIPSGNKRRLRLIPRDALVQIKGKDFVYSVKENKAKMLPLNIVARTKDFVAVDKPPVTTGMMVVIDGNDRLRPDQAVTIIKP
ncbi:MAG: efflux RND transporter periplasmic adaptor subunit, partial [Sedimenticola sp.]